jgi:hypothetical protein
MYGAPENRESDFRGESLMIAARERYQIVLGNSLRHGPQALLAARGEDRCDE